jgi:Mg2+ and Co2+ transporter CorA
MLRTELPFRVETLPQRLAAVLLGEAFLGFLAIVAAALTLFPMLFEVSVVVEAAIDAVQWVIIGWFALEYGVALAAAPAKGAFLRDPWRLVDLFTVLLPLVSLLPNVSRALLSSPVLRLVRLVRLVTLGVRASGVAVRHTAQKRVETRPTGPAQVMLVADAPRFAPASSSLEDLRAWLRAPGRDWYHVAQPTAEVLTAIATALGLSREFLESQLVATNYPHLTVAGKFTALYVQIPELGVKPLVERRGLLLLAWGESVLSFSVRPAQVVERMRPTGEADAGGEGFAARMMAWVIEHVVRQNQGVADVLEARLRELEEVPVRESRPEFFERSFRLKRELSAAQADLWRLKGVLGELAGGRVPLAGWSEEHAEAFRRFATSADYLYETIINIREEVLSVIELHLNIVSFDMNRVMRVLAVVSVLGLIPAVIGGLFGMNLVDNPWPFTLPQVAFAVCFGMVLCLYFFFVKGWLR